MKQIAFILVVFLFFSCQKQNTSSESIATKKESVIMPEGAIPVKYHGHIYLKISRDSVNGNFVFDTGSPLPLLYDSLFYAQSHYKHKRTVKALLPGAGTKEEKVTVVLDSIRIPLKDSVYYARLTPVSKLKPILGDYVDGILGINFFLNQVMQIDYKKEYINVFTSIDFLATEGYVKVEMKANKDKKRFYVPLTVAINDTTQVQGDFLLDLGSGGSIGFTSATATKYKLSQKIDKKVAYYTEYGGIGGSGNSFDFKAKSVKIGTFTLKDVVMDYSQNKTGALSKREYIGILGNDILSCFDVIFDFKNSNLYLKPNSSINEPFSFSRLGFSYVDRNKTLGFWNVTGIYKNSLAEKSGLKIDDKIIRVNGTPVSKITIEKQKNMFLNMETISLTIKKQDTTKDIKFKLKPVLE